MVKPSSFAKQEQNDFVAVVNKIAYRFSTWEVWQDFVIMFATAMSNAVDKVHYDKREAMYMQIVKKYNKQELELFPKLCAMAVEAFEKNREQDFLGEMYMALNLGNHWRGQFFTPYCVCKTMSEITCGNIVEQVEEKGYITTNDTACGAGALLIAFANSADERLRKHGLNFQNHVLFTAQDIDIVTGLMCYIQLSLLGCAGFVKIDDSLAKPMTEFEAMNELSKPESNYWYTPMFFSDVWQYRRMFKALDGLMNKGATSENEIVPKEEIKEKVVATPETPILTGEQLSLW